MKISELIDKLIEFKNNNGDVLIGFDNGYGISWLESIQENTCYEIQNTDEEIELDENGIKFVELIFDYE